MFFYNIWVRSGKYKGKTPLTYSSEIKLQQGQMVEVELQKEFVLGLISSSSTKPRFKIKEINKVVDLPPLPQETIKLLEWIIQYYPSSVGEASRLILPSKLPKKMDLPEEIFEDRINELPPLTKEQEEVLEEIDISNTYLLHGRTGSGKTRVYLELTKRMLENNKSSIILTPEISLTSQLYNNFEKQFGSIVILMHSKQTDKQRFIAWARILSAKDPVIIIGPRSALFSPVRNLGLIVIDESHESSYKQDQQPYYLTARVAAYLNSLYKSILILGSATPSVSDYFLAKEKGKNILKMKNIAITSKNESPDVKLVDLKDKSNFTKSKHISNSLIAAIKESLEKGEQSMLFLNRRGTARIIFCNNCAWELLCKHCDLPMTYHGDRHRLICHTCGRVSKNIPNYCPNCKNDSLIYSSAGTKAIVDDVQKLFPGARISRYDTDNSKKDAIEENLKEIINGDVDILIGTQILAKGFDLPKLTTLGIINADTSLYLPDFSSEERTYQLITQVLGRINRGHKKGKAIIQTYNPKDKLFQYAIDQDYEAFYDNEIANRKKYMLPPYYNLLKLSVLKKSSAGAQAAATKLCNNLRENHSNILVDGPSPSFHEKHGIYYEWCIVVKSTSRNTLTSVINQLPAGWRYDIDPINLL